MCRIVTFYAIIYLIGVLCLMYLRVVNKPKGKYLTICESYRDKTTKKSKERIVKTIGYLDNIHLDDSSIDPIEYYTQLAAQMSLEKKKTASIKIDLNTELTTDTANLFLLIFFILFPLYFLFSQSYINYLYKIEILLYKIY